MVGGCGGRGFFGVGGGYEVEVYAAPGQRKRRNGAKMIRGEKTGV